MPKMIFVNLPVTDLARSTSFYEAIGGTKNPQFSDDTASCIVLSETIFVMLLTHDKYRMFESRPIADAQNSSQFLIAISEDSRGAVDSVWAESRAPAAAPTRTRRRTTASCTAATLPIRMVTPGKFSGWTGRPPRADLPASRYSASTPTAPAPAAGRPPAAISIEMLSGDLTKAMLPSRGGRLMVTPLSIRRWQVS